MINQLINSYRFTPPRWYRLWFACFTSGVFFVILFTGGCSPISVSEEQKKQIVSSDPSFEKALVVKGLYDTELAGLRSKFLMDKNNYESKAAALRKEFDAKRTQFYSEAQKIKAQLDPEREKIKSELVILTADYKNKLKSQKAIKDMLNQAKAISGGKLGMNLSDKDKEEWNKRFDSLNEEYSGICEETASLRDEINILRLKHRSLIQ